MLWVLNLKLALDGIMLLVLNLELASDGIMLWVLNLELSSDGINTGQVQIYYTQPLSFLNNAP